MRLKPIPEPPADLDGVERAQRAVPLVPGSEDDCCARLMQRYGLDDRQEARTWLTFLRAVGLAEKSGSGFTRTRVAVEKAALADAFVEGVFGAREVLAVLEGADGPLDSAAAFEGAESMVPQWERHRNNWEGMWHERVDRLLEWAVLLELAERVDGGYRRR